MSTQAFTTVQSTAPNRNKFDLTHETKFTCKVGQLVPSMVMECVPGDSVKLSCQQLVRFMPLATPTMQRFDVTTHFFFVPFRLLWDRFEKYIAQEDVYEHPYIKADATLSAPGKRLLDYLGVPPVDTGVNFVNISAFPIAAYQFIYNEWYRDQRLITEVDYALTPGDNTSNSNLFVLRKRAYAQDYFTSALPTAQAVGAVDVPIGEISLNPDWFTDGQTPRFQQSNGISQTGAVNNLASDEIHVNGIRNAFNPDGSLFVEPTTINDLRRSLKIQEFLESLNRGGQRYKEYLLMTFGVKSSDARLDRPEYITGIKNPVIISEVLTTSNITGEEPQGTMTGHAVAVGEGYTENYFCEEHGIIMGITSIRPLASYAQGIPRMYLKNNVYDYYNPKLANIGEMAIQKQEIYAFNGGVYPTATFGYTPQYSDYRWLQSRIAGDLRTTLAAWTGTRLFPSGPDLNEDFIEINPEDVERIFAVVGGEEDNIIIAQVNEVTAIRPIPVYGTPML